MFLQLEHRRAQLLSSHVSQTLLHTQYRYIFVLLLCTAGVASCDCRRTHRCSVPIVANKRTAVAASFVIIEEGVKILGPIWRVEEHEGGRLGSQISSCQLCPKPLLHINHYE